MAELGLGEAARAAGAVDGCELTATQGCSGGRADGVWASSDDCTRDIAGKTTGKDDAAESAEEAHMGLRLG